MPRRHNLKWKTTRKAALAAGQKAVESTAAMQERDQESQEQAPEVLKEYLTAKSHTVVSVKDVHSARGVRSEATGHAGHSAKTQRGHVAASAKGVHSEEKEKAMATILKEGHMVKVALTTGHADPSGKDVRPVEREEEEDSGTRQRRA